MASGNGSHIPHPSSLIPQPAQNGSISASADAEREFEEWYAAYPRKRARGQALKAYKAARKKVDAATLLSAIRRQTPTLIERGAEFVPYPQTWLNGERWADQLDIDGGDFNADAILGRDLWSLPTPPEGIEPGTPQFRQWADQQRAARREQREAEARAVLARRGA